MSGEPPVSWSCRRITPASTTRTAQHVASMCHHVLWTTEAPYISWAVPGHTRTVSVAKLGRHGKDDLAIASSESAILSVDLFFLASLSHCLLWWQTRDRSHFVRLLSSYSKATGVWEQLHHLGRLLSGRRTPLGRSSHLVCYIYIWIESRIIRFREARRAIYLVI